MPSARKRAPGKEAPQPEADAPIGRQALTRQFTDRQSPVDKKHRTQAKGTLMLDGGRWTAHDLRRTGATIMGENGVMSEVIERCLNHKEHRNVHHAAFALESDLKKTRRQRWHSSLTQSGGHHSCLYTEFRLHAKPVSCSRVRYKKIL